MNGQKRVLLFYEAGENLHDLGKMNICEALGRFIYQRLISKWLVGTR
jgi:hypothetical protein